MAYADPPAPRLLTIQAARPGPAPDAPWAPTGTLQPFATGYGDWATPSNSASALNTIVACNFPDIEDPAPVPPTALVAPTQEEITAKAELRALFSGIYPPGTREPTA